MIISRTPYRISFLGGGTDYPGWYRKHGGSVLSTTIDKYCYLNVRHLPPFFEHRYRVVYSRIESTNTIAEIEHPAVRAVLAQVDIDQGVEIHHDGDLPARSGMGSSSSFVVGLLHALYALKGRMPTKRQLAAEAIEIEQNVLRETVGSQDQTAAAYGGLNHIQFLQNGEIAVRPVTIPQHRIRAFDDHMMLFYTCIKRTASDVAKTYVDDIGTRKRQLRILNDLVGEGIQILSGDHDICEFGELMHEAWLAKRSLSASVTNAQVDEIYAKARAAGAIGGKLAGAGGGGFMMLFVPPEKQAQVIDSFQGVIHVPFHFESSGSQIIFYDAEPDFSREHQVREQQQGKIVFRELSECAVQMLTESTPPAAAAASSNRLPVPSCV
jgi:D-glycero-alpha-D-manno-heptose-7-phosphate kinase